MDFKRPIQESIKCDEDGYLTVSGLNYKSCLLKIEGLDLIQQIIDTMGELSAKAQKLYSPITSLRRLFGTNQKIFMKVQGSQVLGFIKVGTKNLFHRSLGGQVRQIQPLCVLDFYVHESVQRSGVGKGIFQKFLATESKQPALLAYDRPSSKFLAFLNKHYNLSEYVPQGNNFVIFDDYFKTKTEEKRTIPLDSLSTLQGQFLKNKEEPKSRIEDKKTPAEILKQTASNDWGNRQQTEVHQPKRYSVPWTPWATYDYRKA